MRPFAAKVRAVTDQMTHSEPPAPGVRSLRVDARDNRDRIIEVARATFAVDGLDVTMREIARRAGVGVATLYRRFPTKEMLIVEAFAEQMKTCAGIVDAALADPEPWRAFCGVIHKVCAMQAASRGFTAAFVSAFPDAIDFEDVRERAWAALGEVVRRAKEAGHLRPDFTRADLTLVIMANSGIRADTPQAALAASRRLAALLLQSFRAHPVDPPPPLPPSAPLPLAPATATAG